MDTVKESIKEAGVQISQAVENVGDKLAHALTTGGIAGATAYAIKNTSIPPAAKAGLVVISGVGGSLIHKGGTIINNSDTSSSNITDHHPDSPTEGVMEQFSQSLNSPFEYFDIHN
jgi:hypothetical protein